MNVAKKPELDPDAAPSQKLPPKAAEAVPETSPAIAPATMAEMIASPMEILASLYPHDHMGPLEGMKFIRQAKAVQRAKVVVLIDRPALRGKMLEAGADAVLEKPFDLPQFRSVIYTQWKAIGRTDNSGAPAA